MESLAKIGLQKKRIDTYEEDSTHDLLEDISIRLTEIEKMQTYQLSEQEKVYFKTLSIEELFKVMSANQQDMKKNIDILIDKWGDK